MQMRSWSQGVTAKILGVALLSLLMLIPLGRTGSGRSRPLPGATGQELGDR